MTFSAECPMCKTPKKVRVEVYSKPYPHGPASHSFFTMPWGYATALGERIIEAFCPRCGIKFIAENCLSDN